METEQLAVDVPRTYGPVERRRLRFVAVRGPAPSTFLRFHPRITVLAGFGAGVAEWLAQSLANGRDQAPDGFAEFESARVGLPPLPPDEVDTPRPPRRPNPP